VIREGKVSDLRQKSQDRNRESIATPQSLGRGHQVKRLLRGNKKNYYDSEGESNGAKETIGDDEERGHHGGD